MTDDKPDSGIKSFGVGFGPAPSASAIQPPPPYRVLIAGDFGIAEDGNVHDLAGSDVADLLDDLRPSIPVSVDNLLGSHPSTVTETFVLSSTKDLRPETLLSRFAHYREAKAALDGGTAGQLDSQGQTFDLLAVAVRAGTPGQTPPQPSPTPSSSGDSDDDLLKMLSSTSLSGERITPETPTNAAKSAVNAFISESVTPHHDRSTGPAAGALDMLTAQGKACLGDARLAQILENWASLRLFMKETAGEVRPHVHLLQVSDDSDENSVGDRLAGDTGALLHELYDVILLANRQGLGNDRIGVLKRVAAIAHEFDTIALASAEIAPGGHDPSEIAALDNPEPVFEEPGFEAFAGLRAHESARHLALFWNDALLRGETDTAPALMAPAAWVGLILIVQKIVASGWPVLPAGDRRDFDDLDTATITVRGREMAIATRALLAPDGAAGLARIGLAGLCADPDRTSVFFAHTPVFARASGGDRYRPVSNALSLARLNMLLQDVLMEHLDRSRPIESVADAIRNAFADMSRALAGNPTFTVDPTTGEDGRPLLAIAVHMPEGVADGRSFTFQIPF